MLLSLHFAMPSDYTIRYVNTRSVFTGHIWIWGTVGGCRRLWTLAKKPRSFVPVKRLAASMQPNSYC